jgi:hypothetical protein
LFIDGQGAGYDALRKTLKSNKKVTFMDYSKKDVENCLRQLKKEIDEANRDEH